MPHPRANGAGSSRQQVNQVYSVIYLLYQPRMYDDTTYLCYQGIDGMSPGMNAGFNIGFQARGKNYYYHPLSTRNI